MPTGCQIQLLLRTVSLARLHLLLHSTTLPQGVQVYPKAQWKEGVLVLRLSEHLQIRRLQQDERPLGTPELAGGATTCPGGLVSRLGALMTITAAPHEGQ